MKRSKKLAGVGVGMIIASVIGAVPAQAGPLEIYMDLGYGGVMLSFSKKMTNPYNLPRAYDDRLSSYKNKTNWDVAFYHGPRWQGALLHRCGENFSHILLALR
jgi:hypothetical protein